MSLIKILSIDTSATKNIRFNNNIINNNYDICDKCNTRMTINNNINELKCPNCCLVITNYDETSNDDNGVKNKTCVVSFGHCLWFGYSSEKHKSDKLFKEFIQLLSGTNYHIQRDIIQNAVYMFLEVENQTKSSKVDNRKSLFGACIYYTTLNMNKTIWEKREIARALNLRKEGLSIGCKRIINLYLRDKISIKINHDTISLYTNKYIELFGFDKKYKDYIITLVNRLNEKHIAFKSLNKSKVVGSLYWLSTELNMDISQDEFSYSCFITKPTFNKVSKAIVKYKEIIGNEYFDKLEELKK